MIAKIATLEEVETYWSFNDVSKVHEILDVQEEAERLAIEKAKVKT